MTQADACTLTFDSNVATDGNGGGVYQKGTPLTLKTPTFTKNTATNGKGGGLYDKTICTLIGCTFGGATNNGNQANFGGGIYIEKDATVTMTSDGANGTYQAGITNEVTHNKAKVKAGGVYKDGTLKVEGHVIVTENTAEHSTGGGGGGGKSADGSGQPEAGAIPAGTAAEKEE